MKHVAWKLTKARYAFATGAACDGTGAMISNGRWHRKGIPVVYASEHPALTLLETLVHLERIQLLILNYLAFPIRFDDDHLLELAECDLPGDWNAWPWPASAQDLGVRWFEENRSVVLRVPSAIAPNQHNYLINPRHPDFPDLKIGPAESFPIDPRLIGPFSG